VSYELAKNIGVRQMTAWFMLHQIRSAMKEDSRFKFGENSQSYCDDFGPKTVRFEFSTDKQNDEGALQQPKTMARKLVRHNRYETYVRRVDG
jgi:hypothetical protein